MKSCDPTRTPRLGQLMRVTLGVRVKSSALLDLHRDTYGHICHIWWSKGIVVGVCQTIKKVEIIR